LSHLADRDQFAGYGSGLVAAAVFLVFALARKYLAPAPGEPSAKEKYSPEELDSRFGGVQWLVGLGTVVVGLAFTWSTHAALLWLNRSLANADGPARFELWPQSVIWWFFPGFGALALSWEITLQLWSYFGGRNEADLYSYWSSQRVGFDSRRVLRWVALLVVVPIGILTVLALPMHEALREHDIRDCGYAFGPCKTFPYSDARRLTMIEGFRDRNGKLTDRAGIVIDFDDGRRWSSADIGDFNKSVDPTLASFLSGKTGLSPQSAETEDDIPRLDAEP
jgi:hypothetical protein